MVELISLISGLVALIAIIGFFILCNDISRMKQYHIYTNKLLADQNNLLSEQITIMKGNNGKS